MSLTAAPPTETPTTPAAAAGPRLPWRRRVPEVLAVSAAGAVVSYVAARYSLAGPLLALGAVLLMVPAVFARWRAPVLGWLPASLAWLIAIHMPLDRFGWFVPWLLLPILTWHFVAQPLLAALLRRATGWPAVLVLPLAVGAGEWTREYLGVGDFNMYQAGTFLFEYPRLIQAADLVGSLGLSVLWTVPFAALVDLAALRLRAADAPSRRAVTRGLAAAAAVVVFLLAYGSYRLATPAPGPSLRVALVQPAVEHRKEITPEVTRQQAQLTVARVPPGSADVVAWPENAILATYERRPEYKDAVTWVARATGAPLLFGAQGLGPENRPTCIALLVGEDGAVRGRYEKVVLFPFTERRAFRPLEKQVPWLGHLLTRLTTAAWSTAPDGWSPDGPAVIRLPDKDGREGTALWTPICYESCYAWLGRAAYAGGARVFVNLTSEGWLGWAVSNNQLGTNVMRAVENRVGLVRVANTGPSGFVAPDGRIEEYVRGERTGRLRLDAGVLVREVGTDLRGPTVYSRFGGVIDPLWFVALAGATVAGFVGRRRARGAAEGQDEAQAREAGREVGRS